MPTKLSVNLDAMAYLRNRRDIPWRNLLETARAALDAGADGITVHPQPDQQYTRFSDVSHLSKLIASEYPQAEFNVEGYPSPQFMDLVHSVQAHQATLVSDAPGQITSDHGWDFDQHSTMLEAAAYDLRRVGLRVSLFVDEPMSAWEIGVDRIEFYTGAYGGTPDADSAERALASLVATAEAVRGTGHNPADEHPALTMNAGFDLTSENLTALNNAIPDLAEVSVGHGLTAHALMHGFPAAVRRCLAA